MANKTINDVLINVKFDEYANHTDNLVSKESLQISLGKIQKWKTDFHSCVWDGNAATVNNHTVLSDVPADAVFTDAVYALIPATPSTLGGIIVGSGLTVTNEGILDVIEPELQEYREGDGISFELPSSEYQQVKYIMSTGNQYIATNIKSDGSYIKIKISYHIDESSDWGCLFQASEYPQYYGSNQDSRSYGVVYYYGDNKYVSPFRYNDNGNGRVYYNNLLPLSNSRDINTYTFEFMGDGTINITGNDGDKTVKPTSNGSGAYPIWLFGHENGAMVKMKLYGFKAYDVNGILIADLIPVKRTSDNKAGLYDTVNSVFYTYGNRRNTSDQMTVGPDVRDNHVLWINNDGVLDISNNLNDPYKLDVEFRDQTKQVTIPSNALTVNGHTVGVDVPADAKFTDTTYTAGNGISLDDTQVLVPDGTNYADKLNFDTTYYSYDKSTTTLMISKADMRTWTSSDLYESDTLTAGTYRWTWSNADAGVGCEVFIGPDYTNYDNYQYNANSIEFTLPEDGKIKVKVSCSNGYPITTNLLLQKLIVDDNVTAVNLLPATQQSIGGVIIGNGLSVTNDGTVSVNFPEDKDTTYTAGDGVEIELKGSPYESDLTTSTWEQGTNLDADGADSTSSTSIHAKRIRLNINSRLHWDEYPQNVKKFSIDVEDTNGTKLEWCYKGYTTNGTYTEGTDTSTGQEYAWVSSGTIRTPQNTNTTRIVINLRYPDNSEISVSNLGSCVLTLYDQNENEIEASLQDLYQIDLSPATTTDIGGVIIGDGIDVDHNGVISVDIPEVPTDIVHSETITNIAVLTQAEYDALETPDPHTFYLAIST